MERKKKEERKRVIEVSKSSIWKLKTIFFSQHPAPGDDVLCTDEDVVEVVKVVEVGVQRRHQVHQDLI